MDEGKRKKPHLSKLTLILRIACSFYLLYLAYGLINPAMNTIGTKQVILIGAIIVFTLIAIPLGGLSIKSLVQKNYIEAMEIADEDEENVVDYEEENVSNNNMDNNSNRVIENSIENNIENNTGNDTKNK
jgi:hypothetical protein